MKIVHIVIYMEETYCGRSIMKQEFDYQVKESVHAIKLKSKERWCKTCKIVYNSRQTQKKNLLK